MKSLSVKILLFIVIFITGCEAQIRCYVCTTMSGLYSDKCGDEFRLTSTETYYCQGSCRKTRGLRTEGSRQVVEVTRGCVTYTKNEGCSKGDHLGINADICICNSELCNSASRIALNWNTSVLIATILYILRENIM